MHPIEHGRSGNILNIIAQFQTTQQPLKVAKLGHVRPKSANLKKPLDTNSASRNVPPTPCFQCPEDSFTSAADNLQISTKIILARFDFIGRRVPPIVTRTDARYARPCRLDPLKIEIQPIFLHYIVGMKDENPLITLSKSLERGVDRAALPKSLLVLQDCKLRQAGPRSGCQ